MKQLEAEYEGAKEVADDASKKADNEEAGQPDTLKRFQVETIQEKTIKDDKTILDKTFLKKQL